MKALLFVSMLFLQCKSFGYEMKVASVPGYTKIWLMVYADQTALNEVKNIRLHLHGWTQDPKTGIPVNHQFDFDWKNSLSNPSSSSLKKFIESYGIQKEVENHRDRAILIPISRGHCDQYPELLSGFDVIFSAALNSFGIHEDQVKLTHVSAHSGGGEVLSRLLSDASLHSFSQVSHVTFYDAIYSSGTQSRLGAWISKKSSDIIKRLDLPVITGGTPFVRATTLFSQFSIPEKSEIKNIEGIRMKAVSKTVSGSDSIQLITESQKVKALDHWTIVSTLWNW